MRWSKDKETILVLVLALLVWYRMSRQPILIWVGGVLILTGLFIPAFSRAIHWGWMKLSMILGAIMSRVILTVVFFLVILPLGFISRVFGKNDLIVDPATPSIFKERDHSFTKEDLEHPW